MNIELDISVTVYADAGSQLSKYGKTLEEKLEDIVEGYALEYRRIEATRQVEESINDKIIKSDLRSAKIKVDNENLDELEDGINVS